MESGNWLRLSQPPSLVYIATLHPPGADAANGRIIRMGEGRETKRSHRSCLSAVRRRAGAPRTSNPENHRKANLISLLRYFREQCAVKQTCWGPKPGHAPSLSDPNYCSKLAVQKRYKLSLFLPLSVQHDTGSKKITPSSSA